MINFDEVLSETLFSNWCLIQEELDIVHNTALYCLSRVEMPVDMKCAFLIEAFIGVGEIIQSKKSEFVLPKICAIKLPIFSAAFCCICRVAWV